MICCGLGEKTLLTISQVKSMIAEVVVISSFLQLLLGDLLWTGGEDSSHLFSGTKLYSKGVVISSFLQLLPGDLLWTGGEDSSHPFSGEKA